MLASVYKCLNDQAPLYLWELVKCQDLERAVGLGVKDYSKFPKQKENILEMSFVISQPRLWNELPEAIQNATMLEGFKCM